jgi:hypothetical protein
MLPMMAMLLGSTLLNLNALKEIYCQNEYILFFYEYVLVTLK